MNPSPSTGSSVAIAPPVFNLAKAIDNPLNDLDVTKTIV
jgi:hypothetical protein